MYRISSINNVNNYIKFCKPSFKGAETSQTKPQIEQVSDIKPDFAVKTPMAYTKTGEMNFPYDTKAYCYKLANGQRVIIVPQEGETVLRTYVNTGSMNEPDKIRGISHYIEHNLFNGSEGLEQGDFFKNVDKMGASTNASTGFAETNYYISSNLLNDGDLEKKIKLHASMLETPLFATDKLDKEKGIVNSEINMITSNPENLAVNKMIKNLYGIKSTSSDMIGGTTDNITNLTRDDVVNYYKNNYYPANMVTVISGDVKPDDTMQLISKYFTSKKQPTLPQHLEKFTPTQKAVREDIISDKATASTVVVGFNGPASNNTKDRIYADALSSILASSVTSRIDKNLKQYNSNCWSDTEKLSSNPNDGQVLMFTADCSDENSEKVLKTIFTEIGNIANNPPTDAEMQIIKKKMLNGFSAIFENSFRTNNSIGTSVLENNQDYLNEFENTVKSMTAKDLVDTAKKYLDVNKASVTVVHPASATEETIKQNHQAISFTGAKKEAINMSSVKEYNLNNNFRAVTINSKTNNVSLTLKLKNDNFVPEKLSAALVLDELFKEGTMFRKQEDFETDMAKNGIEIVSGAAENSVSSVVYCDSDDLGKALEGLKESVENPRFTQEDFKRAKKNIKENIILSEKSAYDKLDCELYKGLPEGYSKEEILQELDSLTLDDVKHFYNSVTHGIGEVVVAAPLSKKPELSNTLFNGLSRLKPVNEFSVKTLKDVYAPTTETKVLTDIDFKNQAEIVEAFKYRVNDNIKDKVTVSLLNTILGGNPSSRLFSDLREKEKLAYHVKSNTKIYENIGVISLKIGTTTDNKDTGEKSFENIKKSIDGFNRHIEKIKTEKVTDEELANAKLSLKNQILNSNHASDDKTISLLQGLNSPYGLSRENLLFDEIDKITLDDIYNAANYIFAGKPTYSIVATEDTLKANADYLKSLEK